MDGPGRWNDRIRAKLAPRSRTAEARAYLAQWHLARQRLDELRPDSGERPALEAEIEESRDRYLAAVRPETPPSDALPTSELDRAGGTA